MATKKDTENKAQNDALSGDTENKEQGASLEEVKAQIAEMLAAAQAEANRIVAEAKQAVGSKQVNSRMSAEELERYNAYMNEYVEIELFKDNGKYKDDVFVSVNGENCVIKRGEVVKIKRKFAQVLKQSQDQKKETAKYMDAMSGEWAAASEKLK